MKTIILSFWLSIMTSLGFYKPEIKIIPTVATSTPKMVEIQVNKPVVKAKPTIKIATKKEAQVTPQVTGTAPVVTPTVNVPVVIPVVKVATTTDPFAEYYKEEAKQKEIDSQKRLESMRLNSPECATAKEHRASFNNSAEVKLVNPYQSGTLDQKIAQYDNKISNDAVAYEQTRLNVDEEYNVSCLGKDSTPKRICTYGDYVVLCN